MLKLPIFIFFDSRVAGSCYLSDEQALSLLIALGELSAQYEFKNGKVWLSRPLAVAIAAAYPGAFQFIIH